MLTFVETVAPRSPRCSRRNTGFDASGEPRPGRTNRRRLVGTNSTRGIARIRRPRVGAGCCSTSPSTPSRTALFHVCLLPPEDGSSEAAPLASRDHTVASLAIPCWPFWAPCARNLVPCWRPSAPDSVAAAPSTLGASPPEAGRAHGEVAPTVVHHTRQSRNVRRPHLPTVTRGEARRGSSVKAYRDSFIARQFGTPVLQAPILGCCFSLQLARNFGGWLLRTTGGP